MGDLSFFVQQQQQQQQLPMAWGLYKNHVRTTVLTPDTTKRSDKKKQTYILNYKLFLLLPTTENPGTCRSYLIYSNNTVKTTSLESEIRI